MQIRQVKIGGHATCFANAARCQRAVDALTEKQASKPERELLLADAPRALKKQAGRKGGSRMRLSQARAKRRMTV